MTTEIFYLALVVIFMFLLMMGVGVGAFMVWARVIDGRLRKCPNCNQRGSGYITESEVLDRRRHIDYKGRVPVQTTIEDLNDHYQCEACGHTWSITFKHTEHKRVKKYGAGNGR